MPVVPKLMDVVNPINTSRPLIYPLPLSYGYINVDKYYIPIMIHADCAILIAITTIVAMDTTYTVYVQHACGLFAALGYKPISILYNAKTKNRYTNMISHVISVIRDRLQKLIRSNEKKFVDTNNTRKMDRATYQAVVDCIEMHQGAIRFANAIESTHTIVLLLVIGVSVVSLSVSGYQVIMNFNKPSEAFRFAIFVLAQFFHLFYLSWPGQKLIDHSQRIHDLVYEAQWYETTPRSQKLILLMMMRSIEPCKLTAGKFFEMSFTSFSLIMRTSMSYFTVLTSFT
ncbi:odorant receptor 9a-like isoform X1 [Venturia canescens]|uniref:odorant receptor 9a-like isoform X1 n=1 Tax=Venturia canescens TaxID=32260 RepID=UPI001C9D36BD|nr:odorant receptor 9a-like isoform X1 [Venturia canescens]